MLANKSIDLGRLRDELVAAGIPVANLRNVAGDILELRDDGTTADLVPGARVVIDAHIGPDDEEILVAKDRNSFDQAYDQAIADLTTLANSGTTTFSTAQLSNFMRRNAQIWLKVLPLAKRLRDRSL